MIQCFCLLLLFVGSEVSVHHEILKDKNKYIKIENEKKKDYFICKKNTCMCACVHA